MTIPVPAPRKHRFDATAAAALSSVLVLALGIIVLFVLLPVPDKHDPTGYVWPRWVANWIDTYFRTAFVTRASIVGLAVVIAGVRAFRHVWSVTSPQEFVVTEFTTDSQLYRGAVAHTKLSEHFVKECGEHFKTGIWIAPHVQIPFESEVENIFINGNQKSGKSTIFRALIEQCIRRGDKVLIHCFKGELSAAFGDRDAVLIAPHLKHTWAWDVAADILNEEDARELARRVIPNSDNPFWSDAARAVFTDVTTNLIQEKGNDWTWLDLALAMLKTPDEIGIILKSIDLSSAPLFCVDDEGQPNNTTHGVLATVIAAVLTSIKPLAFAWANTRKEKRFSVHAWLTDPTFAHNVVVFQSSGRYEHLSHLIGRGLLDRVRAVMSSDLADSKERRVVLGLDEMAQLGELDTFHQLIATCRSRGLFVIGATQSIAQLKDLYKERADIIRQLFRWQIVSKIPQGEPGEKLAASLMSKRKVRWSEPNPNAAIKGQPIDLQREAERYPFTPTEMERDLGVTFNDKNERVARALFLGGGDAYLFDWPNTEWLARRTLVAPAGWTLPIERKTTSV